MEKFEKEMVKMNINAIIFVDNSTDNVPTHYIPSNTTSVIKLMDQQEIISVLTRNY